MPVIIEIESTCINCDMCVLECPSDAIFMDQTHYQIAKDVCIQCSGFYDKPTCIDVCPIDAVKQIIVSDGCDN